MNDHQHDMHHHHDENTSLYEELACHAPYAIFSVAFCLTLLSFLSYLTWGTGDATVAKKGARMLFHSFHFLHIVFAATGTLITFFRFSRSMVKGLLLGFMAPAVFCTLSDAILPYIGGRLLGVSMHFHLCFVTELHNVLPFLLVGIINGILMSTYHSSKKSLYSVFSHFIHILISSLASTFYLVAHGFTEWYSKIGLVFVFLIVAVVVPCTLADLVVPMAFARAGKKR